MTGPRALFAFLLIAVLAPVQARAALAICNQTSTIVYAAAASEDARALSVRGWTRLIPGDCAAAINTPLTAARYYVYARTSRAHSGPARVWSGNQPICVREDDFSLTAKRGAACGAQSFSAAFAPLDTHRRQDWTMTLREGGAVADRTAAQLMGVKRLLADNGYRPGAIDAKTSRDTQAALTAFRKDAKLDNGSTNADLFLALEKGAQSKVAPNGLTVCNGTAAGALVATARKSAKGTVSRGWWTVAGKSCAEIETAPLAGDFLLHAQRMDGLPFVTGAARLCVADTQFELPSPPCPRGAGEQGFAAVRTGGKPGLVLRLTEKGIAP